METTSEQVTPDANPRFRVDVHLHELLVKPASAPMSLRKMVNSVERLNEMREFMKGKLQEWNCRAGHNNVIIRVDGTLAPCFPMYSATYDWGVVGKHRFEARQLEEIKQGCESHCFSTLNHNLAYCYDAMRAIKWVGKQALRGFQGVSGSFS